MVMCIKEIQMKDIRIISTLFLACLMFSSYVKSESLNPGDEGWLKAQYISCKEKYDFDEEIFQNCYKNSKAHHTYELIKLVFIEEGRPELAKRVDSTCKKHSPFWQESLDCAMLVLDKLKNKQ